MNLAHEHGFTLHEVLVSLAVGSLLISFGLYLFFSTQKIVGSWERKSDAREAVDRTLQLVANDIGKASVIKEVSDSTLVLQVAEGKWIHYFFNEGMISRNDSPLHPERIAMQMKATKITYVSPKKNHTAVSLSIFGILGNVHYRAETIALVPWSARQEFAALARTGN